MGFFGKFKVDFVHGQDKIVFELPLSYSDKNTGQTFIIHTGFYSDGASIPRILWTVAGHPFESDVIEPAALHDYLYFTGLVTRAEADRILREAMKECGANWFKRSVYWAGVRSGGWLPWRNYRKSSQS